MSTLPEINPNILVKKLQARNAELSFQILHIETLAEALRDERDELQAKLDEVAAVPVVDISTLPSEK